MARTTGRRRKLRPQEYFPLDFTVTEWQTWTSMRATGRKKGERGPVEYSASLELHGTLSEPLREESALSVMMYAEAGTEPREVEHIGSLDTKPLRVVVFVPDLQFDRLSAQALAGHVKFGHMVIGPLRYRHAPLLNLSLASHPIE
jgi:hypothetical protein